MLNSTVDRLGQLSPDELENAHLNDTIRDYDGESSIADGLTDHLFKKKTNGEGRYFFTATTTKEEIHASITQYFRDLGEVDEAYSRQQLLQDLINMVKAGNAAAAKQLTELQGFDAMAETYEINRIDFSDVNVDDSFFEVK